MRLIDAAPMKKGWGQVWQAGLEEMVLIGTLPRPRMVVSMCGFLTSVTSPQVVYNIKDEPSDCLEDNVLFALVQTVICNLSNGINVVIHCFEGKSRSAYLDIAVHMRALQLPYDKALEYVKAADPLAQPNSGFEAQLRRMEKILLKY